MGAEYHFIRVHEDPQIHHGMWSEDFLVQVSCFYSDFGLYVS